MGDNIDVADPVSVRLLGESAQFGDMLPSYKDRLLQNFQALIILLALLSMTSAQSTANKVKPAPKSSKTPTAPKIPPKTSSTKDPKKVVTSASKSSGKAAAPSGPQSVPHRNFMPASNTRTLKSPSDQSAAPSNYGQGSGSGAGSSSGEGSSSSAGNGQGSDHHYRRHRRPHNPRAVDPNYPTAAPSGYNGRYRRQDGQNVRLRRMRIPDTIPENPPPAGIPSAVQAKLRQEGWQIPANGDPIPPPNFQLPGNGGSSGAGSSQGASSSGLLKGLVLRLLTWVTLLPDHPLVLDLPEASPLLGPHLACPQLFERNCKEKVGRSQLMVCRFHHLTYSLIGLNFEEWTERLQYAQLRHSLHVYAQ
ncbi:hypothetical protein MP228_004331 [Amoeboaphelidium protococcarum]|nr:hypothetical protein MP228_004331 [Amoeboaphelidium protococcarum]